MPRAAAPGSRVRLQHSARMPAHPVWTGYRGPVASRVEAVNQAAFLVGHRQMVDGRPQLGYVSQAPWQLRSGLRFLSEIAPLQPELRTYSRRRAGHRPTLKNLVCALFDEGRNLLSATRFESASCPSATNVWPRSDPPAVPATHTPPQSGQPLKFLQGRTLVAKSMLQCSAIM